MQQSTTVSAAVSLASLFPTASRLQLLVYRLAAGSPGPSSRSCQAAERGRRGDGGVAGQRAGERAPRRQRWGWGGEAGGSPAHTHLVPGTITQN